MIDAIEKLFDRLPPLHARKSPQGSAVLGFILGGVGIGVYFLSFVDALIPIGIVVVVSIVFTGLAQLDPFLALVGGAILASLYGHFRALTSNAKLELAVREVIERQGEYDSQQAAIRSIAAMYGITPASLGKLVRRAEADQRA